MCISMRNWWQAFIKGPLPGCFREHIHALLPQCPQRSRMLPSLFDWPCLHQTSQVWEMMMGTVKCHCRSHSPVYTCQLQRYKGQIEERPMPRLPMWRTSVHCNQCHWSVSWNIGWLSIFPYAGWHKDSHSFRMTHATLVLNQLWKLFIRTSVHIMTKRSPSW